VLIHPENDGNSPNKANQLGLAKAAPLRSAAIASRLFAALG